MICDDEPDRLAEWQERLVAMDHFNEQFDPSILGGGELREEIRELEARRLAARKQEKREHGSSQIDDATLLFLDYDLALLDSDSHETGEGLAYLARSFSKCGLIVILNQFGENTFDLTLRGHLESFADLNLGGAQIDNPGLWKDDFRGFRPWSWPLFPRAIDAFEDRIEEVIGHLDERIYDYLGLTTSAHLALPRSVERFVSAREDPGEATFRSFVTESGSALRRKDVPMDDEAIARLAASRISKWLEQQVLPGQDVLVDAPHLCLRYTSLLAGSPSDVNSWNATVRSVLGDASGVQNESIEQHHLAHSNWLSRHAWWWQPLSNDPSIPEVADPWSTEPPTLVFAEDTSRFVEPGNAREFVAGLESPYVRRFVEGPDTNDPLRTDVRYEPAVFFATV